MSEELLDALQARRGIVCAVGAGGKKTALYGLACLNPGRVRLTATVVTVPVPARFRDREIVSEESGLLGAVVSAAPTWRRIAFARPIDKPDRLGGIGFDLLREIHEAAGFEATYVKADGARMRLIKAPDSREPVIPPFATTVLPVVPARVLGQPLPEKMAHRAERVAAVTGASLGRPITPLHVARLLASPEGSLRGIGQASVVPVVNMVDGETELAGATEAADIALELSSRFDRVVLTRMTAPDPLVRIVTRGR
jgi:probable selenium-dependent hydroxylase accessory protein YqeC